MSRAAITDFLQVYRFWLLDVTIFDGVSIPVLNPLYGFSYISAPEVTAEMTKIVEGNWIFDSKIITSGNVSAITLKRGVSALDNDFYNWMMHALTGESQSTIGKVSRSLDDLEFGSSTALKVNPSPRKNLLLIQFFPRAPIGNGISNGLNAIGSLTGLDNITTDVAGDRFSFFNLAASIQLVPARAFMLYGCIPSKYVSTQAFDAKNSEISIQELTLELDGFEQITLA